MTEINVQPKRPNYWWLWVLIVLIAIGVIYFVVNRHSGQNTNGKTDSLKTNSQNK